MICKWITILIPAPSRAIVDKQSAEGLCKRSFSFAESLWPVIQHNPSTSVPDITCFFHRRYDGGRTSKSWLFSDFSGILIETMYREEVSLWEATMQRASMTS